MDYNFKKYKRVFAFGCSFTNYYWPTWADIMAQEMPNAEYYNLGRSGAGNLFITSRISEAHTKMKFTDTDLIMVMWAPLCREDRYFHNNWFCPGNVYTQNQYPNEFVEKFCEPVGYLIKDLSLIQLTTSFLNSLPADKLLLIGQPHDSQQDKGHNQENSDTLAVRVLKTYDELIKSTPPSMFDLEMNRFWEHGHEYQDNNHGSYQDYHPNPNRYYNYLKKLGINLTDKSKLYAEESTKKLMLTKTKEDIVNTFGNDPSYNHKTVSKICF